MKTLYDIWIKDAHIDDDEYCIVNKDSMNVTAKEVGKFLCCAGDWDFYIVVAGAKPVIKNDDGTTTETEHCVASGHTCDFDA